MSNLLMCTLLRSNLLGATLKCLIPMSSSCLLGHFTHHLLGWYPSPTPTSCTLSRICLFPATTHLLRQSMPASIPTTSPLPGALSLTPHTFSLACLLVLRQPPLTSPLHTTSLLFGLCSRMHFASSGVAKSMSTVLSCLVCALAQVCLALLPICSLPFILPPASLPSASGSTTSLSFSYLARPGPKLISLPSPPILVFPGLSQRPAHFPHASSTSVLSGTSRASL